MVSLGEWWCGKGLVYGYRISKPIPGVVNRQYILGIWLSGFTAWAAFDAAPMRLVGAPEDSSGDD